MGFMMERLFGVIAGFLKSRNASITPQELAYYHLKGGSQATLYRFVFDEKNYVARMVPKNADTPTRKHQITIAKMAGEIKVGPTIHYIDSDLEGIVMDFVVGQTVQPKDFCRDSNLANFAKVLKTLHSSFQNFPIATSPFRRFDDFVQRAKANGATPPLRFAEARELMVELELLLKRHQVPNVPTHLDLHPDNIIETHNGYALVDWVNGGMSDPYFDLATFATFHSLDRKQTESFLTHYLDRKPTSFEWQRFILAQPVRLFVIAAILLSLSKDEERNLSYEEALHSLQLPSITDLAKSEDIPLWHFGLAMFKAGLALVDGNKCKAALHNLKN